MNNEMSSISFEMKYINCEVVMSKRIIKMGTKSKHSRAKTSNMPADVKPKKSKLDDNSIFFDVYVNSKFSALNDKILILRDDINKEHKFEKDKLRKLTHKFVVNLYLGNLYGDKWVVLPRGKGHYSKEKRLGKIHLDYEMTMHTINKLVELGYIESKNGMNNREHPELSFCHRMRATEKLKHMFYGMPISDVYLEQGFEKIIKRDENKELVNYKETRMVRDMREQVHTINKLLENHDIGISMTADKVNELNIQRVMEGKPRISLFRKYLVRVFCRNRWKCGGRFYGGFWQNIPKELRPLVTINGEETVELDFDCLHPQMLYAEATGKLCEEDIYSLSGRYQKGSAMRDIIKYAFLVMVNAKTQTASKHKITEFVNEWAKRPDEFQKLGGLTSDEVIRQICETHPTLKNSLCSDAGVRLQYKDSKIALGILLTLAKEKIVALPIHDSFIVQARHEERLRQVMVDEFRKVVGDTPGISKKEKHVAGGSKTELFHLEKLFNAEYGEISVY